MIDAVALPAYTLVRSSRRTLSLCVDANGTLIVRAPRLLPRAQIDEFVFQKKRWILEKQALARAYTKPVFRIEQGAELPWLGGSVRVALAPVRKPTAQDGQLLLPQTGEALAHIRRYMKTVAPTVLGERVMHWQGELGLTPEAVSYTTAKKRWGSMSTKGALRLNIALMHCPMPLIDYVIVHELCHMVQPNHSPAFHALVRATLPDADARRAQLKELSYLTTLLDDPPDRKET